MFCVLRQQDQVDTLHLVSEIVKKYPIDNNPNMEGQKKDGSFSLQYPLLTRSNYAVWAIKMKIAMQAQEVWEAIEPKNPQNQVSVKKDRLAIAIIVQAVPDEILLSLAEKESTKEAWDMLKTLYMGVDHVRTAKVQTLKAEFEVLTMKESETVDDFSGKLSNIVNNIRALGDNMEEVYVVKKMLRAVSSWFFQIASTIEQFADLDTISSEEVVGRLKAHEERIRGHVEVEEKKLLLTHQEWTERSKKQSHDQSRSSNKNNQGNSNNYRGRGRGRGRGGGRGGGYRGGQGRGSNNQQRENTHGTNDNQEKNKIQCYNC